MPPNVVDIIADSTESTCPDATEWLPQEFEEDDEVDNILMFSLMMSGTMTPSDSALLLFTVF